MITVHHLNNSRSQRVLWALEELGLPYEIVKYERDPKTMLAPPELQKVHPLGKSPVITDGARTVAESGTILEYLVEVHGNGKFLPAKDSDAYWKAKYWTHYAEGSLMPFLLFKLVMTKVKQDAPFLVRPIAKAIAGRVEGSFVDPNLERAVKFIDGELGDKPWFAGDELTIADFQMLYPMEALAARWPNAPKKFADWVSRAHARPAYKRAEERGGKNDVV
ncbi:MAG TPA: glutathione S-transferase [Kofleriaceae bacterium]